MKPTPNTVYDKSNGLYFYIALTVYYIYIYFTNQLNQFHIALGFLILSLIISYKVYKYFKTKQRKEIQNKKEIDFQRFKEQSDKVKVELDNVDIKTNEWTDKKTVTKHIGTEKYEEYIEEDLTLNRLYFEIPYKEKKINIVSEPFYMDRKSLEIKLELKKTTQMYINPNDINEFYIDLDFLEPE